MQKKWYQIFWRGPTGNDISKHSHDPPYTIIAWLVLVLNVVLCTFQLLSTRWNRNIEYDMQYNRDNSQWPHLKNLIPFLLHAVAVAQPQVSPAGPTILIVFG